MKILLATGNAHKLAELKKILPQKSDTGTLFEYLSFADFPQIPEPQETAQTLEGNAIIKAKAGLAATGLLSIADDTGLMVDFLNGAPGVHSARYAGNDCDYAKNNIKLLAELKGVSAPKRTARFCTVAAMVFPNGNLITEQGCVEGHIGFENFGTNGFGYDPLFTAEGFTITMAQMTAEQKNAISHRFRAFSKIAKHLLQLKNGQ